MSDCCSTNKEANNSSQQDSCCAPSTPRKAHCPACNETAGQVSANTLLHQLHAPFNQQFGDETYYFCESPACEVVYFNLSGNTYQQGQLRQTVSQKTNASDRLLCYCFDIHADKVAAEMAAQARSPSKEFVVRMTKEQRCACDLRNPAGRCCLKDFPK